MAGGWDGNPADVSSTEVLRAGGSRWRTGGALPSARSYPRGVTVLNQFYVTGECWAVMMYLVSVVPLIIFPGGSDNSGTLSDVLRYERESKEWTKTVSLVTPRYIHGVSTVNRAALATFCSPDVESGTIQTPNYPDHYPNNYDQVTQSNIHYTWSKIIRILVTGVAAYCERRIPDYAHV